MPNFEIGKVFKETNNDDLNKDFLGVFPSDKINKFVMFEKMMPGKKYPFIIWSDESGTHWWSILNISPKSEILLIDSFGITGMKRFTAQGNKKIVLEGIETCQ